ncbi:hypothetical protein [Luteolibacter sp. Populi]|uniref:hypothetical protein n=1 Tax=Luteolibacter sp. Populi TaxID=3230487 RepID=UPI0034662D29
MDSSPYTPPQVPSPGPDIASVREGRKRMGARILGVLAVLATVPLAMYSAKLDALLREMGAFDGGMHGLAWVLLWQRSAIPCLLVAALGALAAGFSFSRRVGLAIGFAFAAVLLLMAVIAGMFELIGSFVRTLGP